MNEKGKLVFTIYNHTRRSFFMNRILFFLIIIACTSNEAFGQLRSYSNEFLALGVGARSLGMGNVQVANVDDVTSAYWNPAGLNSVENFQVGAMHSEWFAGIGKYDYIGFARPLNYGEKTIGLSLIRFGVDDIPNTLNIVDPAGNVDYDRLTTFSAADYAVLLSYAQEWKKFRVGGNAKIIHRKVGDFANAWGFGLDLGAQYDIGTNITVAATLKDVTTTPNLWSFNFTDEEKEILALTDNVIPSSSVELTGQRLILGGAYRTLLDKAGYFSFLGELDLDLTIDERNTLIHTGALSIDPHVGVELGYKESVFLRLGVNNLQRVLDDDDVSKEKLVLQPNAGVGLKLGEMFTIDYALTGFNNFNLGLYSHVFSVKIDFNKDNS